MTNDYQRARIVDQMKRLKDQLSSLDFDITRTQRNEEFEINRVKNEYQTRISIIENNKARLNQDILKLQRELERYDQQMIGAKQNDVSPAEEAKARRLRGHL